MKRPITLALILAIIVTIILSMYINNLVMQGAQHGANNIDLDYTINARVNPEKAYWDNYPYSLGAGAIGGIIVFIIVYFLTPKRKKV